MNNHCSGWHFALYVALDVTHARKYPHITIYPTLQILVVYTADNPYAAVLIFAGFATGLDTIICRRPGSIQVCPARTTAQ